MVLELQPELELERYVLGFLEDEQLSCTYRQSFIVKNLALGFKQLGVINVKTTLELSQNIV